MGRRGLDPFEEAFSREGGRCFWCRRPVVRARVHRGLPTDAATLDHLVPRARGGRLTLANVVLACTACNNERGDRPAGEFARAKGIDPARLPGEEA